LISVTVGLVFDDRFLSSPYAQREDWCRRPEVADFKSE
jgi:hypothetical protein